jgi:trehalose/maltose hydrolase-like predicted phosphorylase
VFGFGGLQFSDGGWKVDPKLPEHWTRLSFRFFWKGEQQLVDIRKDEVSK